MTLIRKRFVVSGHVQGVGFRYFTQRLAERIGIAGTVRNDPNGNVIAEAEGLVESVEEFQAELRKGPSSSRVTGLEADKIPLRGESNFRVLFE